MSVKLIGAMWAGAGLPVKNQIPGPETIPSRSHLGNLFRKLVAVFVISCIAALASYNRKIGCPGSPDHTFLSPSRAADPQRAMQPANSRNR